MPFEIDVGARVGRPNRLVAYRHKNGGHLQLKAWRFENKELDVEAGWHFYNYNLLQGETPIDFDYYNDEINWNAGKEEYWAPRYDCNPVLAMAS